MSFMKKVLDIAYEMGFNGNSWNSTVEFIQDSSYGKILETSDYSFDGILYDSWILGHLDYCNEVI